MQAMLRYSVILIFLLFGFVGRALAHSDTIFSIAEDGTISGLPAQYSPAKYLATSHTLSIGKNTVSFPSCLVSKFFPFGAEHKLLLSGSWYHRRSILPPYLSFKISFPERPYALKILLELDSLKIIDSHFEDQIRQGEFIQTLSYKLEIDEQCLAQFNGSIRPR
jgi:hypothetical protein